MSLEIRKSSTWWYGVFMVNGKRIVINLEVPITGKRPPKRTMIGDDEFERSRGRAMEAYEKQLKKMQEDRTGEKALRKLAEMKTGREVSFPKLSDLGKHWEQIPRRKAPNDRYAGQCKKTLERFANFVKQQQPDAIEFIAVKPSTARAFMDGEEDRKVSPKTWNDTLKLLRATFKHLHPHVVDGTNPFYGLVTKATETINREPFKPEELKAITETCSGDDLIRPVILTGMCTAMRRGDCCLLKWKDVDLHSGFISVKTAKTGGFAEIPIFSMLREELERAKEISTESEYCFPKAAAMYQSNPDGITWRVKQVIARALKRTAQNTERLLPECSMDEVRARVMACLDGLGTSAKVEKMRAVVTTYLDGKNLEAVMLETGCSRGTVSKYLNDIEGKCGCCIIRGKRRGIRTDGLQKERPNGKRRASVRDFHSFRVTWITLALAAGVPLELVQRVTGHQTVAVVLKHYFHPGREDFRQILNAAMPKLLTAGKCQSPLEQVRDIVARSTASTAWKDIKAIRAIVAGV